MTGPQRRAWISESEIALAQTEEIIRRLTLAHERLSEKVRWMQELERNLADMRHEPRIGQQVKPSE